jgi:hypothetical protein
MTWFSSNKIAHKRERPAMRTDKKFLSVSDKPRRGQGGRPEFHQEIQASTAGAS